MTVPLGMDVETAAILAVIALAEGVARLPPGSTLFRRTLGGRWRVARAPDLVAGWGLLHRWPPLSHTILVPVPSPDAEAAVPVPSAAANSPQARLHAIRIERRTADALGFLGLCTLVLGIPAAVHAAGVFGGVVAIVVCIGCQVGLAGLEWIGLKRLEVSPPDRWRRVRRNLNLFSAPAASSRLMAEAVLGAGPVLVARALLPPEEFVRWSRPLLYDARIAGSVLASLGHAVALTDQWVVEALDWRPAMGESEKWCDRCAAVYQSWATECGDCRLPLLSEQKAAVTPS